MAARNESGPGNGGSGQGRESAAEARPGDVVTIHYTSRNGEGGVFETSENRRPLQFALGKDPVIAGIAEAVVGMRPGERRTIEVPAERAFGKRDPSLEQSVSRASLPENLEEGDQLSVRIGERELDVWVRSLGADTAVLDANHPLAGEPLVVDVELVAVERPPR